MTQKQLQRLLPFMQAKANGKIIQMERMNEDGNLVWDNISPEGNWDFEFYCKNKYRIKPREYLIATDSIVGYSGPVYFAYPQDILNLHSHIPIAKDATIARDITNEFDD